MENKKQTERNSILYKKVCDIQPEKTREYNEMGFSQIYSELFSDELVYNDTAKNWFFYDGIRWRVYGGPKRNADRPAWGNYAAAGRNINRLETGIPDAPAGG